MKACGIDLGTTNSCICVVDPNGNLVITDENGNQTFPSVVYAGRDGKAVVGHAARNRMGERPGPVATIKRKMGSTETVLLGSERKTPVEVSAIILAHLKAITEKQLQDEVDRAVVTVPAYFSHIQRQQTDDAAKLAGFREVTTLLEPIAAALAYSLESQREHLRVFVYDMGGGTFDATVLEKDAYGGLNVLSFGGDPFLGGDDLDARVVQLLLNKLTAKNYRLNLDLNDPEDFSRYQKLKFYAESAKIALSSQEMTTLVRQGLFLDQNGDIVDMDVAVTRLELEDATRDLIERSIRESLETLAKKSIPVDSIDEVIMVGGMSRMPLVQQMLERAFQKTPQLVNPDLIVAQGAALKAAQIYGDRIVASSGLALDLQYDSSTYEQMVSIRGVFNRVVSHHTVFLLDARDERYQRLDGTDRFQFEKVELQENAENIFTLGIEDENEKQIIQSEIRIVHQSHPSAVLSTPGSVVTKPISIWTLDGPQVLFPENTTLPHTSTHKFVTADQSGRITAPIWEGNHEVERLEIEDIPANLPIGTEIVVKVSVEADYHIYAMASVPAIHRSVDIRFRIEPVDTSGITPEFVGAQLAELEMKAAQTAKNCPAADEIELFWFKFRSCKAEIEVELSEVEPKRLKLHEKLAELEALIRNLPQRDAEIHLKPSFEEFSRKLSAIVEEAIRDKHPELPRVRPMIETLQRDAQDAWKSNDRLAWARVNNQLTQISCTLVPQMTPAERVKMIAAYLIQVEVPEISSAARGRFQAEIDAIRVEAETTFLQLQAGLMSADTAADHLITFFRRHVAPLRTRLGLAGNEESALAAATAPGGSGFIRAR